MSKVRDARQRYYAALEHETAAQRLFDGHGSSGSGQGSGFGYTMGSDGVSAAGAEDLYSELGMRVYRAFENLLGNLANIGSGGGWDMNQQRRLLSEAIQPLCQDLEAVRQRLERQETLLNEIAAGMRRIDRFTLEAFQRMSGQVYRGSLDEMGTSLSVRGERLPFGQAFEDERTTPPKRLAKEETIARALAAGRRLRSQGRKLTLKSVAEAAGLKYSQIVYAFGSKDEMIERVERETAGVANAS